MTASTNIINELYISTKDVDFVCLTQGDGPLVLLVHGFPDIPHSWSAQMEALSEAGYRVVVPYLPGYLPAPVKQPTYYDKASLVHYFSALIEAISLDKKIHYIGQDWGAIIGYALSAARPDLLASAVLMAVPHPDIVANYLFAPKHVHRSFHWWFFQQKDLPEKALLADDMYFIDYLWQYWSVPHYNDADHLKKIKDCLRQDGVIKNSLAYYRAMFDQDLMNPSLHALRSKISNTISIPTLALCGEKDMRAELMREQGDCFSGLYEYREVPDAGHFLQREQSHEVNQLLLDWLAKQCS